MDRHFRRLADLWGIKRHFLKDIYFLMLNDPRFSSPKSIQGVRFMRMSRHLLDNYGVELAPHKLKYLVYLIRMKK